MAKKTQRKLNEERVMRAYSILTESYNWEADNDMEGTIAELLGDLLHLIDAAHGDGRISPDIGLDDMSQRAKERHQTEVVPDDLGGVRVGCNLCTRSILEKEAHLCVKCKAVVCPHCLHEHTVKRDHAIYMQFQKQPPVRSRKVKANAQ